MIPLMKPFFDHQELEEVAESINSGWVTQGPKVKRFEEQFCKYVGSNYACAVSNCTSALVMALKAVGVSPGDVVITTSHTFIATANAIRFCGAEPVFVDIDPDNLNIDLTCLEEVLANEFEVKDGDYHYKNRQQLLKNVESPLNDSKNEKAKLSALLIVHQIGVPADLVELVALSKKLNIPLVEDAACAIGSEIEVDGQFEKIGKPQGEIACFSFHPRKVITTGDGGMLTTNSKKYDDFFRLYRQHGMNVTDQQRHESKSIIVENYITTGFNFRLSDIQACFGIAQLNKIESIISKRRELAGYYQDQLSSMKSITLMLAPPNKKYNWQSYPVFFNSAGPNTALELLEKLKLKGVSAKRGIGCCHQETPYLAGQSNKLLESSESRTLNTIFLPLYHQMTQEDLDFVVKSLKEIID
ncbi:MAG: DegT/DnrJ/EryC1/StrS family aminotransferase [Halobacteriovoraceae bacterium]|jgi:perosamine synthetase|nr:DegT/DnrJ/EryC1/StrS family aminotransferase [Halobacteriovoraceae bacterium]